MKIGLPLVPGSYNAHTYIIWGKRLKEGVSSITIHNVITENSKRHKISFEGWNLHQSLKFPLLIKGENVPKGRTSQGEKVKHIHSQLKTCFAVILNMIFSCEDLNFFLLLCFRLFLLDVCNWERSQLRRGFSSIHFKHTFVPSKWIFENPLRSWLRTQLHTTSNKLTDIHSFPNANSKYHHLKNQSEKTNLHAENKSKKIPPEHENRNIDLRKITNQTR